MVERGCRPGSGSEGFIAGCGRVVFTAHKIWPGDVQRSGGHWTSSGGSHLSAPQLRLARICRRRCYARSRFDESDSMEFPNREHHISASTAADRASHRFYHRRTKSAGGACGGAVVGLRGNGNDRREPGAPMLSGLDSGQVRSGAAARAPVTGECEVRLRVRSRPAGALGRSTCRTAPRTRLRSGRAE